MTEDEGNLLPGAQVGEPVPGEHALDGNDQVFSIWCDGIEKKFRVSLDVLLEKGVSGVAPLQWTG
jgi:hypothetical protein